MLRSFRSLSLSMLLAAPVVGQAGEAAAADWWAYRPLARPEVPAVKRAAWVRSPIDAFVLRGLEARGLSPAPAADRHALLRRVTYDLTGLPPTQAEIDAFVADESPDAYEQVVDRLLASEQYGVKWAQHWLDLVRYAETDGYERDSVKPFVWRYRDWVVDALNDDMPYGAFVTRQLAGDELPDATVADHVATGFYRLGIWDDEPTDRPQHFYDVLDGIADTTARATMAVSMGCARCHDHKKDPLPTREYYGFLGFFENIRSYEKKAEVVPADGAREEFERAMADWHTMTQVLTEPVERALAPRQIFVTNGLRRRPNDEVVAEFRGEDVEATGLPDATDSTRRGRTVGQVVQVPSGRGGSAMRFDGDDHVVVPNVVSESFTVTMWLRSTSEGRGRAGQPWHRGEGLVDGEVAGVADDWGVTWMRDGVVAAGVGNPDTSVRSPAGLHDGKWHHVAFTRDHGSGRIALYVDRRRVDEALGPKQPLKAATELWIGGTRPDGRGYRGDLYVVRFYDRALSQREVVAESYGCDPKVGLEVVDDEWIAQWNSIEKPELATVEVLAVRENGRRGPAPRVRVRGNVHAEGAEVALGLPAMLGGGELPAPTPVGGSTGRRTALAKWITAPDNRLTWRVIANRLWQHHFGRGIVRSSNDFGRLGDRPTHPELLDWLACEVLARGQSLKAMHRLIVTSSTYRMSSQADDGALLADPLNDAFWRFDRRRLTAEEVRDSILAVNGTLNPELAGPSVYPPLPKAVLETASRPDAAWGRSTREQAARRSLYVHVKRSLPEPLLQSFDRADTDSSCPVRFATVQPTQALTMVNGDFANLQARLFAARLAREVDGLDARLRRGLELVTQRPARDADLARLRALARDLQRDFGRTEEQALQRCCLVLINCNEFLFLD